jgi:hypothetical protein
VLFFTLLTSTALTQAVDPIIDENPADVRSDDPDDAVESTYDSTKPITKVSVGDCMSISVANTRASVVRVNQTNQIYSLGGYFFGFEVTMNKMDGNDLYYCYH